MSKIKSVYVFPSNVQGFLHADGKRIHHTDWGNGAVKNIGDVWQGLPREFAKNGVEAIYVFKNGEAGFLQKGRVYHSDWTEGTIKPMRKVFKTIPEGWDEPGEIKSVYVFPSNVQGFLHADGKRIHHTDWGNGAVKNIGDVWQGLPREFAKNGVEAIYVFKNGEAGFLRKGEVYHTDWTEGTIKPIRNVFKTIPADWVEPVMA